MLPQGRYGNTTPNAHKSSESDSCVTRQYGQPNNPVGSRLRKNSFFEWWGLQPVRLRFKQSWAPEGSLNVLCIRPVQGLRKRRITSGPHCA